MKTNAHHTLRISLAAVIVLLLFAERGFAAQTYVVRRGETLHIIAKKFGTTVAELQTTNHLNPRVYIRAGRTLIIPSQTPTPPADPITYGCLVGDRLEVKSGENTIATLSKGEKFVVLAREGDLFNIKLSDGRTGYVRADAITLEETRKPLPISDKWAIKREIVRTACAYRGARYRRGGVSSRSGFDCSGFVKFLYATKSIKLPHSSRALFKCGTPVAKSDLQAGDMVFFAGTRRRGISHVGLYIGEGKFIHASTRRRGVRVDYLDAAYYRHRYVGARRI